MARVLSACLVALTALVLPASAAAQNPDPDRNIDLGQPDFTLSALPTTMRLPTGAFAFRLTHRFTRPIDQGTVGDFFRDFFGLDSASRIALELRYGLRPGTQIGISRSNDRAIQLFGQQTLFQQKANRWISVDAFGNADGADNFTENYSGAIGAVVSHVFSERAAIYAQPFYVWNVTDDPTRSDASDWTACVGFGARLRLWQSKVYLVAEAAPQVAGVKTGADHVSVGIERRAGAHMFQFTVANNLGTSLRNVARGGVNPGDWYVGFNLTRRFY